MVVECDGELFCLIAKGNSCDKYSFMVSQFRSLFLLIQFLHPQSLSMWPEEINSKGIILFFGNEIKTCVQNLVNHPPTTTTIDRKRTPMDMCVLFCVECIPNQDILCLSSYYSVRDSWIIIKRGIPKSHIQEARKSLKEEESSKV